MTVEHVEVRRGQYHDSVTLLSVSRAVGAVPGVAAAQVAMATPLNLDLLSQMGFELPDAGPDDLVVALRFDSGDADRPEDARAAALSALESALVRRSEPHAVQEEPPRTTAAALRRGWAPLVLVSVPGPSAGAEAWDALEAGSW
ncbi:MAG: hypothetical protein ACLGIA_03650 [Actinomycetes bacterium]